MANLLSLRAARGDVIIRFDDSFFDDRVAPLLQRRGFTFSASARGPADLAIACEAGALERFLTGKDVVPRGRVAGLAVVWRALALVEDGRGQVARRAREVGATGDWASPTKPRADWVRGPEGRRVKGRAKQKPSPPLARPPAAGPPPLPGIDPESFAVAHLRRFVGAVVPLLVGADDAAVVVVVDGAVSVGGVAAGVVGGRDARDRREGP